MQGWSGGEMGQHSHVSSPPPKQAVQASNTVPSGLREVSDSKAAVLASARMQMR
jgi:hypothetical protein